MERLGGSTLIAEGYDGLRYVKFLWAMRLDHRLSWERSDVRFTVARCLAAAPVISLWLLPQCFQLGFANAKRHPKVAVNALIGCVYFGCGRAH